jgi:DDE superfamily endonuclease
VVKVSGGSSRRVSLAALVCIKPGCRPRLIYRVHHARRRRHDPRKGFTETDFAALLDAAHQQLRGPIVLVWDNLNVRVSGVMAELIAARDWLRVYRLPPYAHELNPVEPIWSHLKRSLANLAKRNLAQLTALSRPGSGGCSTGPACPAASSPAPGLDLTPFCNPRN